MFVTLWVRFDMVKEVIGFYGEYQSCRNLFVDTFSPLIHPFYCFTKIVSKMTLRLSCIGQIMGLSLGINASDLRGRVMFHFLFHIVV